MLSTPISFVLVLAALQARADRRTDEARLGTFYTSLPLYRSGAGTNILPIGIGSPPQQVNLTLTTNVPFVAVVSVSCERCTDLADRYDSSNSNSYQTTRDAVSYSAIYPVGSQDVVRMNGLFGQDILTDPRGDTQTTRPIATVDTLFEDPTTNGGDAFTLSSGSSGFWGLGIFQTRPQYSILDSVLLRDNDGRPRSEQSYTVGFDIATYSHTAGSQAGTVHWGGVPTSGYQGDFNWIETDRSKAGSWAVPVDRMRVGSTVVDTSSLYGSLDAGYDAIYVPTRIAESFFSTIPEAERDRADATRWNVPCDLNISMTITISGHEYNVASSELVQARDFAGRTCWSSIVAWSNGSVPESLGEIRLGTPFLSGVCSAIYYSQSEQYVGLAGKPGSVNDLNVNAGSGGGANTKLAGILIGSLLAALLLIFAICYSRNRNSLQSMWYRGIRRQHRYMTNAMVRGATLPPAMAMPPIMPLMAPRPMGVVAPMGPMAPMGAMGPMPMGGPMTMPGPIVPPAMYPGQMNRMMFPPPPYQHPMQPAVQQPPRQEIVNPSEQQGPHTRIPPPQPIPPAVEPASRGIYSPRSPPTHLAAHGHRDAARATAAQARSPKGHLQGGRDDNQGIPHPASDFAQRAPLPPAHGPSSHRFGAVLPTSQSKHSSLPTPSPLGAPHVPENKTRRLSTGSGFKGHGTAHDAWVKGYSGPGQDQQPYPVHKPARIETTYSGVGAVHPGQGMPLMGMYGDEKKKRPWSWARRSARGSEKGYSPVLAQMHPPAGGRLA